MKLHELKEAIDKAKFEAEVKKAGEWFKSHRGFFVERGEQIKQEMAKHANK